jgi:hypothetical protein
MLVTSRETLTANPPECQPNHPRVPTKKLLQIESSSLWLRMSGAGSSADNQMQEGISNDSTQAF